MRLIDADAFKDILIDNALRGNGKLELISIIDNAPTVEERQKGEWIVNVHGSLTEPPYFCSKCNGANNWKAPFCEYCGADMRGGRE